jgi:transposase-like protein
MAKVQKTYTREFKEEAVRLAQISGKPIAQVARELAACRREQSSGHASCSGSAPLVMAPTQGSLLTGRTRSVMLRCSG